MTNQQEINKNLNRYNWASPFYTKGKHKQRHPPAEGKESGLYRVECTDTVTGGSNTMKVDWNQLGK